MLGFQEPLDCRTSFCGVLDLRTRVETEERRAAEITGKWDGRNSPIDDRMPSPHPSDGRLPPSPHPSDGRLPPSPGEMSVLTPPRDVSLSPPIVDVVSPSLAIAQRVLAAATAPQGVRPFKAYPKDPVALSPHSDAYLQFRQHMLTQVRGSKSCLIKKRPASPVSPHSPLNQQQQPQHSQLPTSSGHDSSDDKDKDAAYWERRRKNNEAAKRSRDARRAKEDEIAIRAAFLEQENLRLKYQVAALTDETAKLRCLLYKAEGRCLTTGSTAGMTMT